MNILAVEDDPVAQLVLSSSLQSLGHRVVLAADGEAAWEAMMDRSLRVVVSDWQLPKLDGLDLCRRIRRDREDYVSFILLTQQGATDANLEEAFVAGVDDFLTKPVSVRDLRLRLRVAERILGFTSDLKTLESFLPICTYCKKVRNDDAYWTGIETYFRERAGTRFSHGCCPDCYEKVVKPQLRAFGVAEADMPKLDGSEE